MAAQELGGGGRRAGARVEEGNVHFAARERSVEHRQIGNHDGEKTKAGSRFEYGDDASERRVRRHVAQAEREERRAAEIQLGAEGFESRAAFQDGCARPLHHGKGQNQAARPDSEQRQDGERAEDAQETFAAAAGLHAAGDEQPRRGGVPVERARQPDAASDATRQDDGLKRVPQDDGKQQNAYDGDKCRHGPASFQMARRIP